MSQIVNISTSQPGQLSAPSTPPSELTSFSKKRDTEDDRGRQRTRQKILANDVVIEECQMMHFPLLSLPAEIRKMVYEQVCMHEPPEYQLDSKGFPMQLGLVSKQVRSEAYPVIFRDLRLCFRFKFYGDEIKLVDRDLALWSGNRFCYMELEMIKPESGFLEHFAELIFSSTDYEPITTMNFPTTSVCGNTFKNLAIRPDSKTDSFYQELLPRLVGEFLRWAEPGTSLRLSYGLLEKIYMHPREVALKLSGR